MRLLYFDLTKGNRIGAKALLEELGLVEGLKVIAQLKWRELNNNPFKELNKKNPPSKKEKLSQRQMAPLVIVYQLLLENGRSKKAALEVCNKLAKEVAVAFLDYNVPKIQKKDWKGKSQQVKENKLSTIVKRFFNVSSVEEEVSANDNFKMTVLGCHFATYAKQLNVPELGPIFCAADGYYFEHYQSEVQYNRTQTLTDEIPKPCNFSFQWKEE